MRISDWSSDVCSSDLLDALDRRVEIRVARIERLDQDRAVLRPLQPHRVQSVALGGEADVVDTEALDGRFLDLPADANLEARKSVVEGKSESVRVDPGGRRIYNKKKQIKHMHTL